MEATLRVVGRLGIDSVTHRAVAAEAGLSVGAISHHFKSRDALVEAALRFAVQREMERLRALVSELQDKVFDYEAWTKALAGWYARDIERDAPTHIACFEAFLAGARDARYRTLVRDWFDTYAKSAELAMRAAGSKRPPEHARIFVATIMGLVLQQVAQRQRGFQQLTASLLKQLIEGLVRDK
jgi:DNA-binding transcriptional regulator YbjK